jgi:amino-acid N-acetyltransferase
MNAVRLRTATPEDLEMVTTFLTAAGLPAAGVAEHLRDFLLAEQGKECVGVGGLEIYGEVALLRSLAVRPQERNSGIGATLLEQLMTNAHSLGVLRLVLLTTTAERFFVRKGFVRIDRSTLSGPITGSKEFTGACPSSAVCMELTL